MNQDRRKKLKRNEFTGNPIRIEQRIEKNEKYRKHQQRLQEICDKPRRYHISGVYLATSEETEENGEQKIEKTYYKNYYRNARLSKAFKRKSNRSVRRYQGQISKGSMYRKIDFFKNNF